MRYYYTYSILTIHAMHPLIYCSCPMYYFIEVFIICACIDEFNGIFISTYHRPIITGDRNQKTLFNCIKFIISKTWKSKVIRFSIDRLSNDERDKNFRILPPFEI